MDKEIRSDAKLKNLDKESLEELWRMRYPEDGEKKLSYAEIQMELPRYGHTASVSTLSDFYSWLRQKREMEESVARAEEAKLQYLEENPDASPEALMALGQLIFTNKSIQQGDLKGYVKMAALMERRKAREFNQEKFQHARQSDIEKGLDALFEEIKGNGKAEKVFAELKEILVKK